MTGPVVRKCRCAVYTRKSSEEGLDQEFNSLDAQREACEAYIASQKAEGWILVPDRYDDGGVSGGTLERPALRRLLADIEARKIDVVVVYKIDRLSRSLLDFTKLVEAFDRCGVTFVSVTQSFSTTTSMGRLTLNILLSFAQFEREVSADRIRDKIAASRKKGIYMGGWPALGYDARDRRLVINEAEAATVRWIFERFVQVGSATKVAQELIARDIRTKRNCVFDKKAVRYVLRNRCYLGEAVHKGSSYPGEHQPIVDPRLWHRAQAILKVNPRKRANNTRAQTPALLKGLLFGPDGSAMTPTHTRKKGRLYRYYVAISNLRHGIASCPLRRVPAGEVERAVTEQVRNLIQSPEIRVKTWAALKHQETRISEAAVSGAFHQFDELWDELFPAEQARIVQLLVDRVDIGLAGVTIRLKTEGLTSLVADLRTKDGISQPEAHRQPVFA